MSAAATVTTNGHHPTAEPLPLTRHALAAWVQWMEAADEHARRTIAASANLGPRTTAALDRLAANIRRAGPQRGWALVSTRAAEGYRLAPEVLPTLLDGLDLAPDCRERFVKAVNPETLGVEWSLDAALRERLGGAPNPRPEPERGKRGRRPVPLGEQALAAMTPPPAPRPQTALVVERPSAPPARRLFGAGLQAAVERFVDQSGMEVSLPVFWEEKCRIADALAVSTGAVEKCLKAIRSERLARREPAPEGERPTRPPERETMRASVPAAGLSIHIALDNPSAAQLNALHRVVQALKGGDER